VWLLQASLAGPVGSPQFPDWNVSTILRQHALEFRKQYAGAL
jgi:hypothetical protein